MKTLKNLALTATAGAFGLIVFGSIVRITGSGMGCGDDWPLCNGRLIPPLHDVATLIEWGHRLVALLLAVLTAAVAVVAYTRRAEPGVGGPGGALNSALLAVVLLGAQVLLGAITVWLELPPTTVVLHLATAMALIAALLVTALRADQVAPPSGVTLRRGAVLSALGLGAVVILFGAVTANMGAGPACLGFPLCNGQLWPTAGESGLPHIHWTHRLLAYALFFHFLGVSIRIARGDAPGRLKTAVWTVFALMVGQIVVAAVMVSTALPPAWRALHVAFGTGLWVALVYCSWLVSQYAKGPASQPA